MPLIDFAVFAALAVVFSAAGMVKLLDSRPLARFLATLGWPRRSARIVSAVLPWAELTTGVFFLSGITRFSASVAAVVLLLTFDVIIVVAAHRQLPDGCGCFGRRSPGTMRARTLVRNLFLTALAVQGLVLTASRDARGRGCLCLQMSALTRGDLRTAQAPDTSRIPPATRR